MCVIGKITEPYFNIMVNSVCTISNLYRHHKLVGEHTRSQKDPYSIFLTTKVTYTVGKVHIATVAKYVGYV